MARTTVAEILQDLGIAFQGEGDPGGRPGWVQVTCPDCGDQSSKGYAKKYLGISLSTGAANCWRCGRKNTATVLAAITGVPVARVRERLDGARMAAPLVRRTGRLVVPAGVGPMGPGHRAYLAARGLDAAVVARVWGVCGIGQVGGAWRPLRWRLYIPIHHHGEVVSWTTRTIQPNVRTRYVSAAHEQEVIHHKDILYGADYAHHTIIIHEGPVDVWATGPGAVATLGTGYTEAQLRAMSNYLVRVVCFDSEPEAQRRARGLAAALSPFPGETHNVVLETGSDPADADPEELAELRAAFLA